MKKICKMLKKQRYNKGMKLARVCTRTARILRRDNGEIGKLVSEAIKAKKEADRLKEKEERCRKALDTARQQMRDAAKELTAGINETAVKRYHSSRAEIVRLTEKIEEYEEEIAAQREKMNAQYGKAVNLAQGKAKREMLQDAERARKRREKREQMQKAESAAEKETKAMAEQERAEEKTPPQEERENEEAKREGHEEAEREQTLMMNEAEME